MIVSMRSELETAGQLDEVECFSSGEQHPTAAGMKLHTRSNGSRWNELLLACKSAPEGFS